MGTTYESFIGLVADALPENFQVWVDYRDGLSPSQVQEMIEMGSSDSFSEQLGEASFIQACDDVDTIAHDVLRDMHTSGGHFDLPDAPEDFDEWVLDGRDSMIEALRERDDYSAAASIIEATDRMVFQSSSEWVGSRQELTDRFGIVLDPTDEASAYVISRLQGSEELVSVVWYGAPSEVILAPETITVHSPTLYFESSCADEVRLSTPAIVKRDTVRVDSLSGCYGFQSTFGIVESYLASDVTSA